MAKTMTTPTTEPNEEGLKSMRKTYRFSTGNMKTNMPLAVTPHNETSITCDNPYLPARLRRSAGSNEIWVVKDLPKINWRGGKPVVAATSFRGALRHMLVDFILRGQRNVPVSLINYLAIGGVRQKNAKHEKGENGENVEAVEKTEKELLQSASNIEKLRSENTLIALFGACDPLFIGGAFQTFADMVPKEVFTLDDPGIIRTEPMLRDRAAQEAADMSSVDELKEHESVWAARKTDHEATIKAIKDQKKKAEKNGDDLTALEAALQAAQNAYKAFKKDAPNQTKHLNGKMSIPAGVVFNHHFHLFANEAELALMIGALSAFGCTYDGRIGSATHGTGGALTYVYDIEEESGSFPFVEWKKVGRVGVILDDDGITRHRVADGIAVDMLPRAGEEMQKLRDTVEKASQEGRS